MMTKAQRRVTGGFSLDDAARLACHSAPERICPICSGAIVVVAPTAVDPSVPERRVSLMWCGTCGKSLILDEAEPDL